MDTQNTNTNRFSRQRDIVPAERINNCRATVIGVGAIGRQTALQLAAIGIPQLQLIDFDIVEESNIASQGYFEADLNKPKAQATGELCLKINSALELKLMNQRFQRSMPIGNVVFCCVDSIETRDLIWQAVRDRTLFFCDGRMSAETLRIITAYEPASRDYYSKTLFSANQAYVGPCTAKTTIYCANIAAGLMLRQFTLWLRFLPLDIDIQLNLLTDELTIVC